MRKIKGFKLNLKPKEIQRRAKKIKLDLAAQGLGSEEKFGEILTRFSQSSSASVVYDSFPAETSPLSPLPGLAFSLGLVTLGPGPGELAEEVSRTSPNPSESRLLLNLIAQSALDDATRFVLGLIEEEAKEEHCQLSPLQLLSENPILQAAVSRLEGHKIGVSVTEEGLKPAHTTAFSLSWLARSRSRA